MIKIEGIPLKKMPNEFGLKSYIIENPWTGVQFELFKEYYDDYWQIDPSGPHLDTEYRSTISDETYDSFKDVVAKLRFVWHDKWPKL